MQVRPAPHRRRPPRHTVATTLAWSELTRVDVLVAVVGLLLVLAVVLRYGEALLA
jgi:hypothetical protein